MDYIQLKYLEIKQRCGFNFKNVDYDSNSVGDNNNKTKSECILDLDLSGVETLCLNNVLRSIQTQKGKKNIDIIGLCEKCTNIKKLIILKPTALAFIFGKNLTPIIQCNRGCIMVDYDATSWQQRSCLETWGKLLVWQENN